MTDKMREVFETMSRRFRVTDYQLKQDADGCYLDKETQSYWVVFGIAWAESREALVIELPELHDNGPSWAKEKVMMSGEVVRAIEAVGLKVVKP